MKHTIVGVDLRAERGQALDVQVDRAAPNVAAAGEVYAGVLEAAEQRAHKIVGSAQPPRQADADIAVRNRARVNHDGRAIPELNLRAEAV